MTRNYDNSKRREAALQTRASIVAAASELLGSLDSAAQFSMELVAQQAGVSRMAIYKHFASRRVLLEATLDLIAKRGGFQAVDIRVLMQSAGRDPLEALAGVVRVFVRFWSCDTEILIRLHVMAELDNEFATGIRARNERRRALLNDLLKPIMDRRGLSKADQKETLDGLFALTSLALFIELQRSGHAIPDIERMILGMCCQVWSAKIGLALNIGA